MRIVTTAVLLASVCAVATAPAATVARPPSLILFNLPYKSATGLGVIRPDGRGRRILSHEYAALGWSPDGRQIVGAGYPPNRLVVLDEEGRLVRVLTPPENFYGVNWSPDGSWLAGIVNRCESPSGSGFSGSFCGDLWIVRPDGSEQRRLVTAGVLAPGPPLLGVGPVFEWARDGRAVAYSGSPTSVLAGRPRYNGIVLVSVAGRKVIRAAFRNGVEPTWRPDGRRLAFTRNGDVYVVGRDGRRLERLTRSGRVLQPVWSPDGKRIAYLRARPDDFAVQVRDLRSGRVTQIGTVGLKVRLAWSPDSTRLAWSNHSYVFVARADGRSDPRRLTQGEDPYWR